MHRRYLGGLTPDTVVVYGIATFFGRFNQVQLGVQQANFLMNRINVIPPKGATPVRGTLKNQLQREHTTPRSHNVHRASKRLPCCHKESAVASCLSLLTREPSKRHRR